MNKRRSDRKVLKIIHGKSLLAKVAKEIRLEVQDQVSNYRKLGLIELRRRELEAADRILDIVEDEWDE